ncbi:Mediator of RNA polymerase II transcription subunit 29 [Trichinella pseudospiralis]|uniref:Mediator of RNA polymerase II transcription subunit 29 n=2 Tax=Trichinella pseudospiralis TaxID=6337 RepID=A0A0V1G4L2_TRIPS|nr:Mediator of RNA polymerase II transcription subunit 29 [Trichinella pseudospiralis]KRY93036.1 Mediator of RNA polymerase II transcription subunit 29 [Trichinella pseudospiralis]KRZ32891.1 Mediator of RNA polymerase II transcription subunit 29 [Trichinella pseudospiralis]KRZ46293.1 Mediator of RNA polymerase II transcription subunit 29 [Trichinella pseudospiralis]
MSSQAEHGDSGSSSNLNQELYYYNPGPKLKALVTELKHIYSAAAKNAGDLLKMAVQSDEGSAHASRTELFKSIEAFNAICDQIELTLVMTEECERNCNSSVYFSPSTSASARTSAEENAESAKSAADNLFFNSQLTFAKNLMDSFSNAVSEIDNMLK